VGEVVRVDYLHRGQRRTARIVLGALPSGIGIPPEGPAPGT
jgi:hypothetical protein